MSLNNIYSHHFEACRKGESNCKQTVFVNLKSEMKLYLFLLAAIVFEVLGTMLLPATKNFSKMLPSIILSCSYIASFYFLSLTVGKLPLAIVYSTWAGLGVFTVALLSYFIYQQHLRWQSVTGLFLIVIGVVIVNLYKEQL